MEGLPIPKPLNFDQENLVTAWKIWKNEFNVYIQAMESDTKSDSNDMYWYKRQRIFPIFTFDSPEGKINIHSVLNKFNAYCQPRKDLTSTRHRFFTCKQAENQKFGDYVTELRHKAQESELGQLTENFIQHVLICELKDFFNSEKDFSCNPTWIYRERFRLGKLLKRWKY